MFGAGSNTTMQGYITGIAAHYFNNEQAVVCVCRIAYLINRRYRSINSSVEANGKVGTGNIFINGAGQTNAGNVEFAAENISASERAVSTNDHQAIDAQFFEIL